MKHVHALTVHVHVRVKVADPATLLAVIWYSPLSSRVTSAIVRLVVVTVTLGSVTRTLFLVKVTLGSEGLPLSWKDKENCLPSVGVAVAVVGLNWGGAVGERNE